jgi:tRNA splicing endonuclease
MRRRKPLSKTCCVRLAPDEHATIARLSRELRLPQNTVFRMAIAALERAEGKLRQVFRSAAQTEANEQE